MRLLGTKLIFFLLYVRCPFPALVDIAPGSPPSSTQSHPDPDPLLHHQVATADSFQGEERDLIILATTATSPGDFCRDVHRLNVALTRAKRHLVVVGAATALSRGSPAFRDLVTACQEGDPCSFYQGSSILSAVQQRGAHVGGHAALPGRVQQQQHRLEGVPGADEEGEAYGEQQPQQQEPQQEPQQRK